MFHTKTGLLFFNIVIKYVKENDKFGGNLFNVTHVLNIFKFYFIMEISNVFTIDLTYYFFLNFLGDVRELLNVILFRQIHMLL
jgi:hypothetical protein